MKNQKEELPHIGRLARYPYFGMMAEGHKRLAAEGFDLLDPSYSIVFQFIGDGARITDIAKKANSSKQNVKYLMDNMEDKGLIKGEADPVDKRAWIYMLTAKGLQYRTRGLEINREIEKEWATALGKDNMARLKDLLYKLSQVIEGKYL